MLNVLFDVLCSYYHHKKKKNTRKQRMAAYFMNLFPNVNLTISCIQVMTTYITQQSVIFRICIGHGHNKLSDM